MIKFLYTFDYVDADIPEHERMPFAIRAFAIADKYDIPPLKEEAARSFKGLTKEPPYGDAFSRAVELIYTITLDKEGLEQKLRDRAVKYAWKQYHKLMENDKGFKRVLDEVVGFGSNMVASRIEMHVPDAPKNPAHIFYSKCSSCAYVYEIDLDPRETLNPRKLFCPRCGHY